MNPSIIQSLHKAEEAFYSQRLVEAYNLLRRFYDRIPFSVDELHAKYMGMFVRVLLELGKEKQLQFYLGELEKKYALLKNCDLAYQIGVIHLVKKELKKAYPFFDQVIRHSDSPDLVAKSRMSLMSLYCQEVPSNFVACRSLLDSMPVPESQKLADLQKIWHANILRYEGKLEEAENELDLLLSRVSRHQDWYTHFSAQIILAWVYFNQNDQVAVRTLLTQIKAQFGILSFKSVIVRVDELENALLNKKEFGPISLSGEAFKGETRVAYQEKSLTLKSTSVTDKLLLQILRDGFVSRKKLLDGLSSDRQDPRQMNQAIHSKLSMVRKRLRILGLPSHVIVAEEEGYRFVPEVIKESTQ